MLYMRMRGCGERKIKQKAFPTEDTMTYCLHVNKRSKACDFFLIFKQNEFILQQENSESDYLCQGLQNKISFKKILDLKFVVDKIPKIKSVIRWT